MAAPRWLDEREQHAWRSIQAMHHRLAIAVERQLILDSGLSAADYQVLVPLSESADGRLRARDLARDAGWEKSRLSHQMRRMEQRGLVEREDCATDARGAYVRLTPAGRAAIEAAAPSHVETVRRLFLDLLEPTEVEVLAAVADRVLARLAEEESGCAPAGPDEDTCSSPAGIRSGSGVLPRA